MSNLLPWIVGGVIMLLGGVAGFVIFLIRKMLESSK